MRDDWQRPRGEAERVAARVRDLLDAHRNGAVRDVEGDADWPTEPTLPGPTVPRLPGPRPAGAPAQSRLGRLAARLPLRVDPGRRSAVAVGIAVLVAAVLTGFWMVSAQPRATPVSASGSVGSGPPLIGSDSAVSSAVGTPAGQPKSTGTGSAPGSTVPSQVVVDVAGKVRRPGVYRLPTGSRIDDAVRAAGGSLPGVDLSTVNLAAILVDGQQIAVGRPGAVTPPGGVGSAPAGSGAGTGGAPAAPVDLNTATLEQLETLPGIGPALGQRILDYRTQHGSFNSVNQLDDVSGIGTVIFARLKPLVTV